MNKKIILYDDSVMNLKISPDYCYDTVRIYQAYIENNSVIKSLELPILGELCKKWIN